MAWFLFVDESGHDRRRQPYEVLAGAAIRDAALWPLIQELQRVEMARFGRRYSAGSRELKGKKLLKKRVFDQCHWPAMVPPGEQAVRAQAALDHGAGISELDIKALAQGKLGYVRDALAVFGQHGGRAFASIVSADAPYPAGRGLRKDYAYLFQRFFYFLEDLRTGEQGIIVFDEIDRSKSHLLIDQTQEYFRRTSVGKARSRWIIPEPLFVSSDLTTGIQIADLIAYCLAWGYQGRDMAAPRRPELQPYVEQILALRHRTTRFIDDRERTIWSFTPPIDDLRPSHERDAGEPG